VAPGLAIVEGVVRAPNFGELRIRPKSRRVRKKCNECLTDCGIAVTTVTMGMRFPGGVAAGNDPWFCVRLQFQNSPR